MTRKSFTLSIKPALKMNEGRVRFHVISITASALRGTSVIICNTDIALLSPES